jgi:hypothetical protein
MHQKPKTKIERSKKMRPFILTLAALIVLNFVMPACTPAQSAAQKGSEQTIAEAQKDAEAAAKEAQKQAEAAQNKAEEAQQAAETAQEEAREAMILPSTGIKWDSFSLGLPSREAQIILVIPVDQIKPEDLAAITEDISVMCRVFDKKLKEEMGIAAPARAWIGFPFGGMTGTEGIYLEGYGVLFLLKVDMPLTPPPEIKEEQPKEEGDPLWEETKRELHSTKEGEGFGGGGSYGGGAGYGGGAVIYSYDRNRSCEKYDAEKVERLKTTLIKSLKHAANIRNLKPDESVIISVRGCVPALAIEESVVKREGRGREERSSKTRSISLRTTRSAPVQQTVSNASTVLTIRAKKADIDAFSKGELNFDQFRQKVHINIYQAAGGRGVVPPLSERF